MWGNAVTVFIAYNNIFVLYYLQVQCRPRALLALTPYIHRGEGRNLF